MVDGEPRRGRFRKTKATVATGLAIWGAVELGGPAPTASAEQAHRPGITFDVFVGSRDGSVPTGIYLAPGKPYDVDYIEGQTTVDYRSLGFVGPNGYPRRVDRRIHPGCKVTERAPYGALLGKVGGTVFVIGEGGTFQAPPEGGELLVRFNDRKDPEKDCTNDNADLDGVPTHLQVTTVA